MATTADLIDTLSAALGVEPRLAKQHATALREAGLFPGGDDDRPHPEHAAVLLISLMTGSPPAKSPDAVRLYADLPLDRAHRGGTTGDGQLLGGMIQPDDPFMETLRAWGDSFGAFLATLIVWYNEAPETDFEVINVTLGGGPGTAEALIYYAALTEGATAIGNVKFSLVPLGGGRRPDDAPPARLEHFSVMPGTIFPVLRKLYTGDENGPREVLMSRADLERLSEGDLS